MMKDNYFTDTSQFHIDKFRNILKTKEILPGRVILKEAIDERFDLLKSKGIKSLSDLLDALKTKPKIEKFSTETGLEIEYLTVLRREANSYGPSPINLFELLFLETEIVDKLQSVGIKNSMQLFNHAAKFADRKKLAQKLDISLIKLTELVQLSDLVRITGIGPIFAKIIFDSNVKSVEEFLNYEPILLQEKLTKTNYEKGLTKSKFSIKDLEYCIELGKDLPIILEA